MEYQKVIDDRRPSGKIHSDLPNSGLEKKIFSLTTETKEDCCRLEKAPVLCRMSVKPRSAEWADEADNATKSTSRKTNN